MRTALAWIGLFLLGGVGFAEVTQPPPAVVVHDATRCCMLGGEEWQCGRHIVCDANTCSLGAHRGQPVACSGEDLF